MPALSRTLRVIGVSLAARGRAVDLALIETDGGDLVRRIEAERQPLATGDIAAATIAAVRVFMGDRTLQPFAVDLIALGEETYGVTVSALAAGTEVHCRSVGATALKGPRAEAVAFAAVALLIADLGRTGGGLA
jgi:hypothetical protein